MKRKESSFRMLMRLALLVYIVVMLGLLYGKGIVSHPSRVMQAHELGYWVTVRRYTNFEPLKTILPFVRMMKWFSLLDILTSQTVGNILIFIPCGLFVPYFRKKKRRLSDFFVSCLFLIMFIEITQVLSLFGSFDIDDVILNMIGCLAGYLVYCIAAGMVWCVRRARKKHRE